MDRTIQPGDVVLCLNDTDYEHLIREGHFYKVERTSLEGLIVYLEHSSEPMMAARFEKLDMGSKGGSGSFLTRGYECTQF